MKKKGNWDNNSLAYTMDIMEVGSKIKVQMVFEVCLSPHYATICMELFKIEREAKQKS
jgi:hypothetical protein